MFELPFVERGATLALSTNRYRLAEFTSLQADPDATRRDLERIVADDGNWRGGEDYALAWALTNYLYKRHRARLGTYLRSIEDPAEPPLTEYRETRSDLLMTLSRPRSATI